MRELPTIARRVFAVSILILVLIAAWLLLLRPVYRATAGASNRTAAAKAKRRAALVMSGTILCNMFSRA